MRQYVKENYAYVGKNGEAVPENVQSAGINGDGAKIAGSHFEPITGDKIVAPFGGSQTGERLIFGMPYAKGGLRIKGTGYFK